MSFWKPKHPLVKTKVNIETHVRGKDGKELDSKSLRAVLDQNPQIAIDDPATADLLEAIANGEHGNELSGEVGRLLEQRDE